MAFYRYRVEHGEAASRRLVENPSSILEPLAALVRPGIALRMVWPMYGGRTDVVIDAGNAPASADLGEAIAGAIGGNLSTVDSFIDMPQPEGTCLACGAVPPDHMPRCPLAAVATRFMMDLLFDDAVGGSEETAAGAS